MEAEDLMKRVGVFALVLVIIVGGVAASSAMQQSNDRPAADLSEVDVATFDPGTITASAPAESGEISMSAEGSDSVVVLDMAHENDVSEEQLGPVVRALSRNGATVTLLTRDQARGQEFNETLREADAFVSISPDRSFTPEQTDGLTAFADAGGRVLLLGEPMEMGMTGGIFFPPTGPQDPAPMASMASEFGFAFGNGYLYHMGENANNYRKVYVTPAGESDLTEGVDRIVVREGTTVEGGTTFLSGIEGTALSTTRQSARYPVAATSGNVTAVGDATFFTETGYQEADNEVLTGNLLDFLVTGDKTEGAPGGQESGTDGERTGEEVPPEPP